MFFLTIFGWSVAPPLLFHNYRRDPNLEIIYNKKSKKTNRIKSDHKATRMVEHKFVKIISVKTILVQTNRYRRTLTDVGGRDSQIIIHPYENFAFGCMKCFVVAESTFYSGKTSALSWLWQSTFSKITQKTFHSHLIFKVRGTLLPENQRGQVQDQKRTGLFPEISRG